VRLGFRVIDKVPQATRATTDPAPEAAVDQALKLTAPRLLAAVL